MLPGGKMLFDADEGSFVSRSLLSGSPQGFVAGNLGQMPMNVTISMWAKYTAFPQRDKSRVVVKYGDSSSGVAVGANYDGGSNSIWWPSGLVEAKYWGRASVQMSFGWHHYALLVRAGQNPLVNSVFLDGEIIHQSSGDPMYVPSNQISFLGRSVGDDASGIMSARVCIYNGLLSDSEIANDIAQGAAMPGPDGLVHFYDGTVDGGLVRDMVGDWHLEMTQGCSVVDETPWSVGETANI